MADHRTSRGPGGALAAATKPSKGWEWRRRQAFCDVQSGAESEVPPPGAPRHRVVWGAGAAPRRAWAVFLESQANRFAGAVRRDENGPSLACLRRGLYRQFDSAGCRCATQPGPRPAVSSDDGRRYGVVNLVCRPGCQLLWQTQFEVAY